MKTTTFIAQLRREFVNYRYFLPVWLLFLVLHAVAVLNGEHWAFHVEELDPLIQMLQMSGLLFVVLPTLYVSKASAFWDLPSDPAAFWRAKPISGHTMVAAKILALGLMFVVPPLCIDGYAVVRMGGSAMLGGVLLDHILVRWSAMAAMLALAALSGGPYRLVALVVGGMVVVGSVVGFLSNLTHSSQFDYTATVIASRILVAGGLGWLGSVTVMLLLYVRQRVALAYVTACTTALAIGLVFLFWPVDFYRYAPRTSDSLDDMVQVTLGSPQLVDAEIWSGPVTKFECDITVTHAGIPPFAWLHKASVQVTDTDDELRARSAHWQIRQREHDRATEHMATADRNAILDQSDPAPDLRYTSTIYMPDAVRLEGPAGVSVQAELDLFELVHVGDLVLEEGSTLNFGYGTITVRGVGWNPIGMQIEITEKVLQPLFAFRGPITALPNIHRSEPLWTYVVPGNAEGTLAPQVGHADGWGSYLPPGKSEGTLFSLIRYRHQQVQIGHRPHEPNSVDLVDQYRGRTLQVYQRMYRGSVRRTAVLNQVRLESSGD